MKGVCYIGLLCKTLSLLLLFLPSFSSSSSSAFNVSTISFDEGYSPLFGDSNLVRSPDGRSARLLLDVYTGAGFISSSMYHHGFFSAKIKLPGDYTAGIVVAFYTSNVEMFEKNHDELDFEFLGNVRGRPWKFQTNMYGNGSTNRGREERYSLWFDPTKDFHTYTIAWTNKTIIFYVDEVPIREVVRNEAMRGDYPSKPMKLYGTIWDGSSWATNGGKHKADYKFAPFAADFNEFILQGCPVLVDQLQPSPSLMTEPCSPKSGFNPSSNLVTITPQQRAGMRRIRQHYMYYSYCYDRVRYPVTLPECVLISGEKERFNNSGRLRYGGNFHRQGIRIIKRIPRPRKVKRRHQSRPIASAPIQAS